LQQRCSISGGIEIPTPAAISRGVTARRRRRFYVAAAKHLLSTRDAAARVGVHERTLRRYIACGQIASRRLPGGHYRISPETIDAFLQHADAPATGAASDRPTAPAPRRRDGRQSQRAGQHGARREYDLSPANLARLRARFGARSGGDGR
jgi:excisionase family DNA binding protein